MFTAHWVNWKSHQGHYLDAVLKTKQQWHNINIDRVNTLQSIILLAQGITKSNFRQNIFNCHETGTLPLKAVHGMACIILNPTLLSQQACSCLQNVEYGHRLGIRLRYESNSTVSMSQ